MSECGVKEFKLRELLKIYNGTKYDHLNKGDFPLYGSGGLMSHVDEALYSGEAILLPRKGTLSNIMYVNESFWTVDTMYYAVVNDKFADAFYLYSYLSQLDLSNLDSGSTLPSMTKSAYESIVVKLPDLKIQKAVATILFNIRKKLETNNQINQELEAMAKTLYDYWFVQFDFPDQNGKPYKSSGGKMVYHPELKREIPEGWGVESVVDNTLSKVIKPGIDHFTQKTYLATGDVVNTSIKDGRLITFENRETRANMQPSVNSVWFAKMKSSNKHLFLSHSMKELIDSTILSTGFMGLQCKEESFEYIASFISDPNFEIFKDTLSHGATQEAVNIDDLRSVPVIIPDDYILREFHRIAKSIFLNLGRNMIEDKTLSSLRDWLLPMLMNGQVKVE